MITPTDFPLALCSRQRCAPGAAGWGVAKRGAGFCAQAFSPGGTRRQEAASAGEDNDGPAAVSNGAGREPRRVRSAARMDLEIDTAEQLRQMRAGRPSDDSGLDRVLATEYLAQRVGRAPDYEAENEALQTLAQTLARSPETLLQTLCELTLGLCRAVSAGVSILEEADGVPVFRWRALAGGMARYLGGIVPPDFAPCGVTMERDAAQLFTEPGLYYPYAGALQPPIHELLMIPFHVGARPVGTVWMTRGPEDAGFDAEDVRLLTRLADFAAAGWRVAQTLEDSTAATRTLRDTQERLEATLNAGDIATWTWDIQADRVYADQNLARFFALTPEAADGGPIAEYTRAIHPEDRERVRQDILKAIESGGEYESEYRLAPPQGETRWVIARGRTELDGRGRALRLPGVVLDITARKAAEEAQRRSEERYHTLFQAIDEGFCVIEVLFDSDGAPMDYRFLEINPAFEQQTGLHGVTGKRMRELVSDMETSWYAIYGRVALTGEPVRFVNRAHALDDRWFDVYAFRLGGERSRKVAILFRDVSAARRSEQMLRDHMEEVAALNERLKRAMAETHHRVKNNLQMIAAMIEMQMLEHHAEQAMPMEEFAQLKTHIHTLAIVHDLLTQGVQEAEDAQRVSARAVLEQLLPMLNQTAWNQEVRFTIEDARLTAKQSIAIALVLNELVTNALKHGSQGAEVCFRVEGEGATLEVSDDGPGFPADFDPMLAANMGLELVESLIRTDLKGFSRYENRPQGGGRVLVSFPLPPVEL